MIARLKRIEVFDNKVCKDDTSINHYFLFFEPRVTDLALALLRLFTDF